LAGSNNILGATTDLTLAGAGPTGATTAPRLNLNGTTQSIRSIAGSQSATVDLGVGGTLVISGAVSSQYRGALTGTFSGGGTIPSTLVKDGAGVLSLGETLSNAAVPSTVNSFQRLIVRNGGIVAVSSPNSLPQSFNASLVSVPADGITLDGGTLRVQSITNTLLNAAGGSTFAIASGAATQRGITVNAGGGTFEVTNAAETALAQIDNATSFDIVHGPATAVIHKTGPGALRLGPGNSFQGKWDVREGNLQFSGDSALGDTTFVGFRSDALAVANGAMIQSLGSTILAGTRGITLTGGSGTLSNSTSGAYFNGTFTVSGPIAGAGGLTKVGAGPLTLSNGSNNFAGDLRIQSGTVNLATNSAGAGSIVVQAPSSSGINANTNVTIPNAIQLADASEIDIAAQTGATFTLNGALGGPGSFFKLGDGTLVLNNAASNFAGTARLMRGVTIVGSDNALGSFAAPTIVAPGAMIGFNTGVNYTAAEPLYIAGDGNGAGGAIRNFVGTTTFAGDVTLMADATIGVPGGSLRVGNVQGNSQLTKVGFSPLTVARVRTAGLFLQDGNLVISPKGASASPAGTSVVGTLSLLGDEFTDVTLDITDNAFVVDYTGGSPFSTIRAQIISAYNGGGANAWTGPGITSSLAAPDPQHFAVGYAEASAVFTSFPATFAGVLVDNTSVLIRHTRSGDANLDGIVNLADFNRLASNFGQSGRVWSQADFNHDGLVNLADFNLLASNFGLTATGPDVKPQDWASLASAVPEPSIALLLLSGVPALAGMRRRRRAR
jgi:autotransporter-associated beta strand protein